MLGECRRPLSAVYDLAMLDLDGVVYIGDHAVPGAPEQLRLTRASGMACAFVTNNASRSPAAVAAHLRELGIEAADDEVVTSAQAAATLLAGRLPPGSPVGVLGSPALAEQVELAGLAAVAVDDAEAQALVSGYGPEVLWRDVMRAAVRVRDGLWWVASNADGSIPTSFGEAPGHGVLVETVSRFSGVRPEVAGKPERPLFDETIRRAGGERPLMVGDRLDTDIAGAVAAGVDSLLVLTGVTGLAALASADSNHRPTYLATDLRGLNEPHSSPEMLPEGARCGGWLVASDGDSLTVSGRGEADDWWRAVVAAAWRHTDATGRAVDVRRLVPPPAGSRVDAADAGDGSGDGYSP